MGSEPRPVELAKGLLTEPFELDRRDTGLTIDRPFAVVISALTTRPGDASPWHSHPGPVIVVVTSGVQTLYDSSCRPRLCRPGEALLQPPREPHAMRNEGSMPAQYYAVMLVTADLLVRLEEPSPTPGVR